VQVERSTSRSAVRDERGAGYRELLTLRFAQLALLFLLLGGKLGRLLKSFLCVLVGLGGVFQGLPGVLVCGQVIFVAVVLRRNSVSVRGKIVELSGSPVGILCHDVLSDYRSD
jgi:hypothetical protein